MFSANNKRIFSEGSIAILFNKHYESIRSTINSESENQVLNVNETEYINYLVSTYQIPAPIIHFEEVEADSYEAQIPAEHFPYNFSVEPGKSYKREIIQYFIPCSGNFGLLRYSGASGYSSWTGKFILKNSSIVTEFINFMNDPKELTKKFEAEKNGVVPNYQVLLRDIEMFNQGLPDFIRKEFSKLKNELLCKKSLLSALGVPIRKKAGTPATFSIPKPQLREKIMVTKPFAKNEAFKAEPTLDDKNYQLILKLINDVGKNFERMPSTYKDKREEDLRDHIIFTLDPNFVYGSATGETFNKTGKTDILLRYDSSVVFVTECKFWTGEKGFHEAIDQLLGYLTWRDTKTSLVLFVKQSGFSAILAKVKEATLNHECYLGTRAIGDENWFNYRFHIKGDKSREVSLAVQLFHLPLYAII